jgi:hypothetical protein
MYSRSASIPPVDLPQSNVCLSGGRAVRKLNAREAVDAKRFVILRFPGTVDWLSIPD